MPGRMPIRSSHWFTARLARANPNVGIVAICSARPNGGIVVICSASAKVVPASSSRGTTRFTMPSS